MALDEIAAVARQGWLIGARGLRLSPRPAPLEGRRPVVAFVHGFMAAGPVFDPLRSKVEALGLATLDMTYSPLARFESVAARLADHLHTHAGARPLAIVGHSMGGLLARYAMQEHGVVAERLISIATPHAGTEIARRWPTPLGRALRPGSRVLRRLREPTVPHLALAARHDTMVQPIESAAATDGDVHWLDVGHNAILFHPHAHRLIIDSLRAWRPAPAGR